MDSLNAPRVSAISTKVSLLADAMLPFAKWQAMLTRSAGAADGFVSIEIAPTFSGSSDWQIIQRFRSPELLALWRTSAARSKLFADLAPMRAPQLTEIEDEAAPDFHSLAAVTEVITTVVEPGKERAFQDWAEAVQASQATFPGYMGTLVQAPLSPEIPYWTTLVRFSTPPQLDAWLGSDVRKTLLQRADPSVSTWKSQRMTGPFTGWFERQGDQAPPPAAWKQTALVLLVLFPVVMLEIKFLSPYLAGLNLAIATFIGNAISVSLVSWPLMNIAIFGLGWWLRPAPGRRWQVEILGGGALLALYALELLIFVYLY